MPDDEPVSLPTGGPYSRLIEELEASIRARDDFLAIAAHELRNPMHALALQASSALRAAQRSGNADLEARLERLVLTVNRYVQRANVMLDISRINAGRLELSDAQVDLALIVREVVATFEAEAEHHRVTLDLTLPEHARMTGDPIALEQITTNLVSNAIRYGAGRPVHIELAMLDGGIAELVVRDHGVGISDEDRSRIFGQFERAVDGQARAGFGIGLWLVRMLVEAHRGTILVDSVKGEGSTFTVRLPSTAKLNEPR